MRQLIHDQAADAPAKAVARWHAMDDESVKEIDREILERKIEQVPKGGVTCMGVDEISHKKGHQYLTVVTDLVARRAIGLEEGREAESLGRFFRYLGKAHCADIKMVAVDRWRAWRKALRKYCPRALVVLDKFHIIGDCGEALESLRKRLQRQLDPTAGSWLKRSRWALLKRPERLTDRQRDRLRLIERHNRPLYRAYLLKEELRLFYARVPAEGQKMESFLKEMHCEFQAWCGRVMRSRIPELKTFVRQLRKFKEMVLNYFVHRLTNGLTEGLNSVIRQIQRRACGYRDMAYFTLKVYQKAGVIR
jgi:transposase